MESRSKCSRCNRNSVIELKYLGESLCRRCFVKLFDKRVRKTIRVNKLLKHNDKIGVAVSGGKDSATALYILKKLTDSVPTSEIVAVTLDPGIRGYQKTLKAARKLCRSLDVEQHVFTFKERFGFSNNVMGRFGPPDFEQARFVLDQPELTLEIEAVTAF